MIYLNRTIKNSILFLFTFLFSAIDVAAALKPEMYNFSYITSDDGLAQNTVDFIYKDSRGYMWFATWNGLNRFDGYEFVRYETQSENPINSLFVGCLIEDDYQNLWVGTGEGLNLINVTSGNVLPLDSRFADHPVFNNVIHALEKDKEGNIWIGFSKGLAVATVGSEGQICTIDLLHYAEEASVLSLCCDLDGAIWVGYQNGSIRRVTALSGNSWQFSENLYILPTLIQGEIMALCADQNTLWIGTSNGLGCYDLTTRKCQPFVNKTSDSKTLIQNYVKDIVVDLDGNIIIATFKGISIYDKEYGTFLQIEVDEGQSNGLNNNFVNSLYVDSLGIIWIGTEKGGLNKMQQKSVLFELIKHDPKNPSSLSANPVNAIYEDHRKNLWIGTVEGGLNKKSAEKKEFIHFKADPSKPHSLSHNSVCYLTEYNDDLWIATWGGGLNRMRLSREGVFESDQQLLSEGSFLSRFIAWIAVDDVNNGLWLSSPQGLEFYDISKQTVIPVLNLLNEENSFAPVSGICIDSSRRLWVGTEMALYCIDLNRSDIKLGRIVMEKCKVLTSGRIHPRHERINCIYEAADQSIWVATYGNGLFRLKGKEDNQYVFIHYGTERGLSDNVIYNIREDAAANLWMSTNRGLSCFSPEKERFVNYYISDGLPSNQFYWVAACRLSNGNLMFGNIAGVVNFDPVSQQEDDTQRTVAITGFYRLGERIDPIEKNGPISIREQDKSFSVSFSSLDFLSPEKVRYAYRLDGFDTDWIEVDAKRRYANYTNLSAGKYEFQVRCINADGGWSDQITRLGIHIIPPFYKERWFLTLIVVLAGALLYYINERRIRKLRNQRIQLERMVEERTQKIEDQKNVLLNQKMELQASERRLEKATQDKINFFTNITHEFKTPLTLISGPIEQALKMTANTQVQEQLLLVRNNARYLLSLINQLMDFRKADAGQMKVNLKMGSFTDFIQALLPPFEAQAGLRNIKIQVRYHLSMDIFRFDSDLLYKVLVNLLSNAIKYTPQNGDIALSVALIPADHQDIGAYLYISVRDSGEGIPEESKASVFDRFYQIDSQCVYPVKGQSGTGIGLYLCKQIIHLLNGWIRVKNNPSGGAFFQLCVPLSREDLLQNTPIEQTVLLINNEENTVTEMLSDDEPVETDRPLLLIAEDNAEMRQFIRSILIYKFNIVEAEDGAVAFEKTLKYQPDFIISDLMMPVMDGLEFCKKIKFNFSTSHIPVLLLTAKSSTDTRIEVYNAGADGYIAKPFDPELLISRIANMLESRVRMHKAFDRSLDIKTLNMNEESEDQKFVSRLMEIVQDNYTDPDFDVSMLLDKMCISKSLLHKKLQSLLGQSAVKIIRSFRLTKAHELLNTEAGQRMTVSEVAYRVGFNDPKYFTRCFTRHFGVNPSSLA